MYSLLYVVFNYKHDRETIRSYMQVEQKAKEVKNPKSWTPARSGATGAKGTAVAPQMALCASAFIKSRCGSPLQVYWNCHQELMRHVCSALIIWKNSCALLYRHVCDLLANWWVRTLFVFIKLTVKEIHICFYKFLETKPSPFPYKSNTSCFVDFPVLPSTRATFMPRSTLFREFFITLRKQKCRT